MIKKESAEKFHCPATGLPILRKPEWTDVRFGKDYILTISIIGDNIVFFQSAGFATLDDVKSALRFDARVRAGAIPQNRFYIQITDWTNLKGTSQKARKFYLDNLKNRKRLRGLIIYGASPFLKIGIKLAKRFNVLKLSVTIADDYSTAVRLAQKLLIYSHTRKGEPNLIAASQPLNISHRDKPSNKSITNPNWSYQSDNFSIRFEIINGNVIHGISTGRLEKEHITPSLSLQEEATKSLGLVSDSYYFVLGLEESTGTGQKTRKLYVDAILNLHRKFPFQIFIFYGVNRLLTAAINLVRPLVPFKVRVTKDLDSALALISEEKSKVRCNPNGVMKKISSNKHVKPDHIQHYVDELLEFIEQINWSIDGIDEDRVRDPSHPFSAVFDAIELIKWELDDRYRQHKQAEEELRRSEEQFRKIVESSPMGMHMYRLESGGRLVFTGANPAADTVLGIENKQFVGKTIEAAFPSLVKTGVPDQYRRVCGRGEQWKTEQIEYKDNQITGVFEVHAFQTFPNHMTAMFFDTTARKRAEEALQQSEKKYKTLTNNLQVGIYRTTTGPNGRFLETNPAMVKMFGYQSKAEFFTVNVADLYQNSDNRKKFVERIQKTGFVKNKELHLRKKDGTPFIASVSTVAVKDEKGRVKYYDGVMENITERRQLEKQLQQAQKMEAIGTLAGGVAHDLNNILSGILSYPELLLMDLPENSSFKKPLETIRESGKKAAAIVQDLLTLARRGVNTFEVLNLNDIVSEYLKSPELNKLKSYHPYAEIETQLETNLLNIFGSSVHLFKTIMNLVSNAVESMPEGGRILVSSQNRYIDKPVTGYDSIKEGDFVVLKVSDEGIGICSQDISKIFEPFYTKKKMGRSGTGLGMAVVWGAVKDHKGYIEVQSKKGKGTDFTLFFPVTRKEISKVDTNLSISDYKGDGQSILVIDDIKEQREIATSMLSQLGYNVNAVSSGEKAVKYMRGNNADLLVLDMIMDPGIDGLETYKKILDIHPRQKVILASGYSETDRVKEALNLGAGKYIKKPYTVKEISVAVMEELAGEAGDPHLTCPERNLI